MRWEEEGLEVEEVVTYKYLIVVVSADESMEEEEVYRYMEI